MSKDRMFIEPKKVIVSNPGVNYGNKTTPLTLYRGEVLSFQQRYSFGRPRAVPWLKYYEVRATDPVMALQLLSKLAYRDGYALGGVQNVEPV